ncbi:MAG: hypothetical protein OEV94_02455 [Deltaproteobacteria bacterium]|nr:hypothetical protein [Deltaproteobacteria bacterium]
MSKVKLIIVLCLICPGFFAVAAGPSNHKQEEQKGFSADMDDAHGVISPEDFMVREDVLYYKNRTYNLGVKIFPYAKYKNRSSPNMVPGVVAVKYINGDQYDLLSFSAWSCPTKQIWLNNEEEDFPDFDSTSFSKIWVLDKAKQTATEVKVAADYVAQQRIKRVNNDLFVVSSIQTPGTNSYVYFIQPSHEGISVFFVMDFMWYFEDGFFVQLDENHENIYYGHVFSEKKKKYKASFGDMFTAIGLLEKVERKKGTLIFYFNADNGVRTVHIDP